VRLCLCFIKASAKYKLRSNERKLVHSSLTLRPRVRHQLHADKDAINQRKRVHFVIELAWQGDRGKLKIKPSIRFRDMCSAYHPLAALFLHLALQQLGRTHRSNQVSR
jgi:hypothetical protein